MTKSMLKSFKNSNTVMVPSLNFCNQNKSMSNRNEEKKKKTDIPKINLYNMSTYPLHIIGVIFKLGFKQALFES